MMDSDGTRELDQLVERWDDMYPDRDPGWVASQGVHDTPKRQRTQLLIAVAADRIDLRRRLQQHDAQRQAATEAEHLQQQQARATQEAAWRAAPAKAPVSSAAYQDWVRDTDEGQQYEADRLGRVRADRAAAKERKAAQEAEWAERERLWQEDPEAYEERYSPWRLLQREMQAIVEDIRTKAKLELTIELLSTTFALPGGQSTTWGAATAAQHEARIAALTHDTEAGIHEVALHMRAVDLLIEHKATRLDDIRAAA